MSNTFFISDLHFGHKNILSFDERPFRSVEEHDAELIYRWNDTVCMDDDVWVLGDISWYPAMRTIEIYKQLNGTKHLIRGNHDRKLLRNRDVQNLFCEILDYKELDVDCGSNVVLCHYPIPTYNGHFYGDTHFYGHVHSTFEWEFTELQQIMMHEKYNKPCNMINVGCMMPWMDYYPRQFDEIVGGYDAWCADQTRKLP